jgi:hypothetical protein
MAYLNIDPKKSSEEDEVEDHVDDLSTSGSSNEHPDHKPWDDSEDYGSLEEK